MRVLWRRSPVVDAKQRSEIIADLKRMKWAASRAQAGSAGHVFALAGIVRARLRYTQDIGAAQTVANELLPYSINSAALQFADCDDVEAEGYREYVNQMGGCFQ